jgi:cell division protein FtsB
MILAMPLRGRRSRSSLLARLGRPLLSLGLLTAGLVLAGAFVGIAVQGSVVDRERQSLIEQIAELERVNAEKRREVERRQADDYVIDTARDYGYVRPGEGLIAVEGAEPRQGAFVEAPVVNVDRIARWIAVFFGPR